MGVAVAVGLPAVGAALGAVVPDIQRCAGTLISLIQSVIKNMQDTANKHM